MAMGAAGWWLGEPCHAMLLEAPTAHPHEGGVPRGTGTVCSCQHRQEGPDPDLLIQGPVLVLSQSKGRDRLLGSGTTHRRGHPCWHGHMASEDPRQATAPSMATLAHSPHCHLPHGLPVGLGMWPPAAASLKQGLCTSPLPRPALPGRRLELRAGTSGEGPGAAAICGPQHIASY